MLCSLRVSLQLRTSGTIITTGHWEQSKTLNNCSALLHQIQQLLHERVRFGPIWEYIWPSGIGPRVEEPALMLINPYPWSAPLEEVRLKPE